MDGLETAKSKLHVAELFMMSRQHILVCLTVTRSLLAEIQLYRQLEKMFQQ